VHKREEDGPLRIFVNGEAEEIISAGTVLQLLENHAATFKTAVVEHNGKILKQEHWENTSLRADDSLEILIFMGGG